MGVWSAPGGRETLQKGGGRNPPPFGRVSRPPGTDQTPKIDDFRSGKKSYIKNPGVILPGGGARRGEIGDVRCPWVPEGSLAEKFGPVSWVLGRKSHPGPPRSPGLARDVNLHKKSARRPILRPNWRRTKILPDCDHGHLRQEFANVHLQQPPCRAHAAKKLHCLLTVLPANANAHHNDKRSQSLLRKLSQCDPNSELRAYGSRCPFQGPRGPFKGPLGPCKGPRGPFKGTRDPLKESRGTLKGPRDPFKLLCYATPRLHPIGQRASKN